MRKLVRLFCERLQTVSSAVRIPIAVGAAGLYAGLLGTRTLVWHDAIALPVCLAFVLLLLKGISDRQRQWTLFAVTTIVLLGVLQSVWSIGYAGRNHVFGGFVALSDAHGYYADAERVLHDAPMNDGGARRPLFSATLAGLLRLVGNDVRAAHVVTLLVWSASGVFVSNEIRRVYGDRVADVAFVVFVLFARRYIGFVQSEGLGAPLGAVAFGLVCRAQIERTWKPSYLAALGLQTFALFARPGPFLLVPAMVLWGLARTDPKDRGALLLRSAVVIVAAFCIENVIEMRVASLPAYSDLPSILYGWLHGEDWKWVVTNNPWLAEIPANVRPTAIWKVVGHDVLAKPWLLFVAAGRCIASWFVLPQGLFGFMWTNPDDRIFENMRGSDPNLAASGIFGWLHSWLREMGYFRLLNMFVMAWLGAMFVGACLRAIVRTLRCRRELDRTSLHLPLLGITASLLFLPPWITEGAQINATVFLWIVVFAIHGNSNPPRPVEVSVPTPPEHVRRWRPVALAIAAVVTLLIVGYVAPVRPPASPCRKDGFALTDVDWHAEIRFGANASPTLHPDDVERNLSFLMRSQPELVRVLRDALSTGARLVPAYDVCHGNMQYVLEKSAARDPETPRDRWVWWKTEPTDAPELWLLTSARHEHGGRTVGERTP